MPQEIRLERSKMPDNRVNFPKAILKGPNKKGLKFLENRMLKTNNNNNSNNRVDFSKRTSKMARIKIKKLEAVVMKSRVKWKYL